MTSKYIAKPDRLLRSSLKRLCVSTAMLTVLGFPAAAQVFADGTDETVTPGLVIDTGTLGGSNGSGLYAVRNGTIKADGPLTITTGGYGASGMEVASGGKIDVTGATIKTTGLSALGALVGQGSSIVATDLTISTSGQYSHGVGVYYTGIYTQNGGSVTTSGNMAAGYQVQNGGSAAVANVGVKTSGAKAHGIDALINGSNIRMENSHIETSGAGSNGLNARLNARADLTNTSIVTNGQGSHGIAAQTGAVVNTVNVDVTTHGVGSHGVFATTGGTVTVDGSTISTTNSDSYGVRSTGAGSVVSITNSTIQTEGYGSLATRAENGGLLGISGSRISTTGKYGHGLQAFQDSGAEIENSIIETAGDTAYGLAASAASEIKAKNVIITTEGPRSHGVWAGAGGHIVVDSAIINTAGYDSSGLFTAGGTIDANNVVITTSGGNAAAATAYVGTINLSNSRVNVQGSSVGLVSFLSGNVNATNVEVRLDGPSTLGLQASYGGTINLDTVSITGINGNTGISTNYGGSVIGSNVAVNVSSLGDNKAIGMTMVGGGLDHLVDLTNSSVNVAGEGATGLVVATGGQGTLRLKNSAFEVKDGTAIDVNGSNIDVDLDGSSVVGNQLLNVGDYSGTDPKAINIRATNGSYLEGDVRVAAGEGQHATISLDQGSILKGATDGLHELNVTNKSVWEITGDSNVGSLLNDNGTVAFGPKGAFKTLTVGSLDSRNGSYLFNTKLNEGGAATETDKLVVSGNTTGDGKFYIANRGGQGAVTGTGATDGIKLTDIGGVSNGTFELGAAAIVGIYDYKLVKADGQDWYLQTEGEDPVDPVDPGCEETGTCPPSGHIVDTVPGYNIALAGAQEHILTTLDTFHERVGELRSEEMSDGFHAWTRGIGKTGSYSPKIKGYNGHGFDMTTGGVQIGGDYSLGGVFVPGDKLTLGVFGEYAHSNFNVRGRTATGSISSKGVGAYATWQQHAPTDTKPGTGAYVDAVVKQDWLDFGVEAKSVSGFAIGHSYSGKATSASIETGYGFDLGNNVVLQPQAQLTYSKITADNFMDGNGIAVHGQEAESLRGRLGIRLEKTFFFGDEEDEQVYLTPVPEKAVKGKAKGKVKTKIVAAPAKKKKFVKSVTTFVDANVKHEFKGRNGLYASDTAIGSDMRGTRYDVGIGAEAKVAKNVSFFGRASVEFGGSTDVAGKVSGGLKITW